MTDYLTRVLFEKCTKIKKYPSNLAATLKIKRNRIQNLATSSEALM